MKIDNKTRSIMNSIHSIFARKMTAVFLSAIGLAIMIPQTVSAQGSGSSTNTTKLEAAKLTAKQAAELTQSQVQNLDAAFCRALSNSARPSFPYQWLNKSIFNALISTGDVSFANFIKFPKDYRDSIPASTKDKSADQDGKYFQQLGFFWQKLTPEQLSNLTDRQIVDIAKIAADHYSYVKKNAQGFYEQPLFEWEPPNTGADKMTDSSSAIMGLRWRNPNVMKTATKKDLEVLQPPAIRALGVRGLSGMTGEQIGFFRKEALLLQGGFTNEMAQSLTKSQIESTPASHLGFLVGMLKPEQIKMIPVATIKAINDWYDVLTLDIIKALTKEQIKGISEAVTITGKTLGDRKDKEQLISAFQKAAIYFGLPDPYGAAASTTAQTAAEPTRTDVMNWKASNWDSRLHPWWRLKPELFSVFPVSLITGVYSGGGNQNTKPQLEMIKTDQLAVMTGRQLGALGSVSFSVIEKKNPTAMASLSANAIWELWVVQDEYPNTFKQIVRFGKLNDDVVRSLKTELLSFAPRESFYEMTEAKFALFSASQITAIISSRHMRFDFLTVNQLSGVPAGAFMELSEQQAPRVKPAVLAALTSQQWGEISPFAVEKMTATQFSSLPANSIKAIPANTFASFSTAALAALTTDQAKALTDDQLKALSVEQSKVMVNTKKLSKDQEGKLKKA